jgi:hypothetical protein
MELIGSLLKKFDTQNVSSTFKKREFVLNTDEASKYPQPLLIQLTQDKVNLIDSFNEGDQLKVQINLQGKSWLNPQGELKYFNSITAWRIERIGQAQVPASQEQQWRPDSPNVPSGSDDLPF